MDLDSTKGKATLILTALAVAFGFIFILQNFEQTSFQFLVWTIFSGPKWIVISFVFAIGLTIGYLWGKKKD